jgi:hypothetical protein
MTDPPSDPPKTSKSKSLFSDLNLPAITAGAIAIVSGAAALYTGFTGTLARLSRNEPWIIPLALLLTFFAVSLAAVAARVAPEPIRGVG